MKIAIDIDFTASCLPDFVREFIAKMREGNTIIFLTSSVPEIGGKVDNHKYRLQQLAKLGIRDFDMLLIAEGTTLKELGASKAKLCKDFGVDLLFDDDPEFVEEAKYVCPVFQLNKKETKPEETSPIAPPTRNSTGRRGTFYNRRFR